MFRRLARCGLAGRLGRGTQMFSWIHAADFCRAVDWLVAHAELDGAINLAAPDPQPMDTFTRELRRRLGQPVGLPLPRPLLEIGAFLIRTETELLLKSRWVMPTRLLAGGFVFEHPRLADALNELSA